MLKEIADLGFSRVELSHGVRISLVPGILNAVSEGWITVGSVHNFCPLPTGVIYPAPNYYEPTSGDPGERRQWARYTRQTIEFALRVNALSIIIHCGSVPFIWRHPAQRIDRYREKHREIELAGDPGYERLILSAMNRMRKQEKRYWDRLRSGLDQVIPIAEENGIRIGLENREGVTELPLDDEMAVLLSEYSDPVGYWHDTGHAVLKQNLGILNHRSHLLQNCERLIGFHLHDVDTDERDHRCLGTGIVDFTMVREFFRGDYHFVLELNPRLSTEDVCASRDYLSKLF